MKLLFVCKGNYYRSQMAEAIYNKLTNSKDAVSAGTYTGAPDEPEGQVLSELYKGDPCFLDLMERHGMDIRSNTTKRLTPRMLKDSDIVVSMAEEPYVPDFLREDKRVIFWDIANPEHASRKDVNEAYEKISKLVRELIGE